MATQDRGKKKIVFLENFIIETVTALLVGAWMLVPASAKYDDDDGKDAAAASASVAGCTGSQLNFNECWFNFQAPLMQLLSLAPHLPLLAPAM